MDKIIKTIAEELNIKTTQVENTIKLIDEGNTIPFIARYRKEVTGGLSDEVLRTFGERLNYLRNLETRKEEVIKSIDEQGKLTDEILQSVAVSKTLAEVEDIYRPYKQKKKTRATVAKAKGLEPLAEIIIEQKETTPIVDIAKEYVRQLAEEKGAPLTFCVNTFGCQMNARDSEKLVGILKRIGYVEVDTEKVINEIS